MEFPDQGERNCFDYCQCFGRPRIRFYARKVVATELVNAMMLAPVVALLHYCLDACKPWHWPDASVFVQPTLEVCVNEASKLAVFAHIVFLLLLVAF